MIEHKYRFWNGHEMFYRGLFEIKPDTSYIGAPMQYTGIKDSNNNEIYEGDIVRIIWPNIKDYHIVERRQPGEAGFPEWSFWSMTKKFHYCGSGGNSVEIVGNIYENPELIKD